MKDLGVIRPRSPWLAVLLSLMMAGLGHVYSGRIARGVMIILVSALLGQGALVVLMLGSPNWSYVVSIVMWATSGAIWLYAVVDSALCALRSPPDYQLKDYNRWHIYVALALLTVPMSLAWALVAREGFVEAFYIPVNSMYPTICRGDRVLAHKRILRFEPLRRGDLIIFVSPNERRQRWIKRVVGLPGDTVEMRQGTVLLNGEQLQRTKVEASDPRKVDDMPEGDIFWEKNGAAEYRIFWASKRREDCTPITDFDELTVPPGHCYVLGDNRNHSKDSRYVGPIPMVDVIGRVDYRYFPGIARLR
jgi:signal peptidase I